MDASRCCPHRLGSCAARSKAQPVAVRQHDGVRLRLSLRGRARPAIRSFCTTPLWRGRCLETGRLRHVQSGSLFQSPVRTRRQHASAAAASQSSSGSGSGSSSVGVFPAGAAECDIPNCSFVCTAHILQLQTGIYNRTRPPLSCHSGLLLQSGKGQAKVKLPAVWLAVAASEVLDAADAQGAISAAVSGGATGVVLSEDGAGGSALYDAACRLKVPVTAYSMHKGTQSVAHTCLVRNCANFFCLEDLLRARKPHTGMLLMHWHSLRQELLRGRAALLVVDRTDVVDAAEADGVLLSPTGMYREANERDRTSGPSQH